ncbi:MAG: ferredoxin--NADP reductase [Parvularculaceae bacterium]|nr:ferredoxin--NADP reductase [Parvularculaceae bacterium]
MNINAPVRHGLQPTAALSVETVLSVQHWNEFLFSFSLSRPQSFRFRSGEFVMLGLPGEAKPILRAYSVVSPSWADHLEFLSIKVPDGPLTSRLQKITAGDAVYLGRKPTGTLVADALLPGARLFLLSTGTGLAPFMSLIRDPEIYERFREIVLVHSVRQVSDLAYRAELESRLSDDEFIGPLAKDQLIYRPTVTREAFPTQARIGDLIESGAIFDGVSGAASFNPAIDRVMLCGSMAMIKELADRFESLGFEEGSNAKPGQFVIERAFVG